MLIQLLPQVQHPIQGPDSEVGPESFQYHNYHRKLDDSPEPLDLPGGCVCGRRHC